MGRGGQAPRARKDSGFTLLFEQAVMTLVREMPVPAVARFIGVTDKRRWRIVRYNVVKAPLGLALSRPSAFAFDDEDFAFRPPKEATTTSPYSPTRTAS